MQSTGRIFKFTDRWQTALANIPRRLGAEVEEWLAKLEDRDRALEEHVSRPSAECTLKSTADPALATATDRAITWDTILTDTIGCIPAAGGDTLTFPYATWLFIQFDVLWATNPTNALCYVQRTAVSRTHRDERAFPLGVGYQPMSCPFHLKLAANETVKFRTFHGAGANRSYTATLDLLAVY